jgi:hypothetical protein
MGDYEKQTAFLRQCLVYDESAERKELEEGIALILRGERCLRRAIWLMALLIALVLVSFGYSAVLMEDFLNKLPRFFITFISAVGLASLVSLLAFAGLHFIYRHKLNGRREKCRQLVAKLLESRLGRLPPGCLPGVVKEAETLADPATTVADPSPEVERPAVAFFDASHTPSLS